MPGIMNLRPVAAAAKASRRASRLSEKVAEDRERAANPSTNFKASRVHSIAYMPTLRPAALNSSQPFRAKQVTDPWPENVKARLVGGGRVAEKVNYSSSGSEHEPSSNCLAAMVHEFMEKEESGKYGRAKCNCESDSCNCVVSCLEDDDSKSSLGGDLSEVLKGLAPCVCEQETALLAEVLSKAIDGCGNTGGQDATQEYDGNTCRRRSVMKHLRNSGYNAALCKSRWEHAGSFPGGDYEYIDVVFASLDGPQARVIVDIDFQCQFEIARPSSQYKHVYQALPAVYVGTTDRLLQIVNVMSEAVKRSLKKKGMLLPPWRKPEYVKAKWFSSYKRTTNESPQSKDSADIMSNISLVAVRSTEWDKQFTNEMEREFEKAGSRQVTKEMKKDRVEEAEPEDVVRGANRLTHLWTDVKSDVPREIHELDNMDWQPPALLPRASTRRSPSTGLTSILREAGLIGDNRRGNLASTQGVQSPVAAM
jgi:uncharacterized protein (TIGR01615 family)